MRRTAQSVRRLLERSNQQQVARGLPADRLAGQIPPALLPPPGSDPAVPYGDMTNPMTTAGDLIVGGVAGGASCAARLRRLDERASITVYDRGPFVKGRVVDLSPVAMRCLDRSDRKSVV